MSDSLRSRIEQIAEQNDLEVEMGTPGVLILQHEEGSRQAILNLDSLARLVDALAPWQLHASIEQRISLVARALRRPTTSAEGSVYPLLRPPAAPGQPHWSEPIAQGRLQFLLIRETEDHYEILRPMQLVETKLSLSQLRESAIENLLGRSCTSEIEPGPRTGSFRLRTTDGLAAARAMIMHHLVPDPRGLLLLMPCRDQLWIVPASEGRALELALSLRKDAIRTGSIEPYPISAEIFWQTDGTLRHLPLARGDDGWFYTALPVELSEGDGSIP